MPKHVVVHARTSKWASKHIEFVQHTAHAPNVLGQTRHNVEQSLKPSQTSNLSKMWAGMAVHPISCFKRQRETASKMLIWRNTHRSPECFYTCVPVRHHSRMLCKRTPLIVRTPQQNRISNTYLLQVADMTSSESVKVKWENTQFIPRLQLGSMF